MRRRLATIALTAVPVVTIVGAAASAAQPAPEQPPKTTVATGPTTTVWPTTSMVEAAPSTGVSVAPPTTIGTTVPTSPTAPITFDGFTFLDNFYSQLAVDPFAAANVAEMTAPGSDAYAFVLHEAGAAIAIYNNTTVPLPNYTVTDNGATVSVCNDADECDSFGDFRIAGVALDTFSIDGEPLAQRVSAFERPTTVEALSVDGNYALRRPRDEALSVVVLLGSEGGGTTFFWERASYVDIAGNPFAIDPAASQYPQRIEDGQFTVAHVTFAGAQHGGQLEIPITTDLTRVATTIRIPVTLRS
jgi:hypothetical protein